MKMFFIKQGENRGISMNMKLNRAKIEGSPSENKAYIIDQTYMRMKYPEKMMK
jgi:hypothetical protein